MQRCASRGRGFIENWRRPPLGSRGELAAARFLRAKGFRILAHSYRTPLGEIDLIASDGSFLVFVEVKTRSSLDHGRPEQAVDSRKRRQITRAAVHYLTTTEQLRSPVRFDIVAITWPPSSHEPAKLEHFPDAFPAEGPWSV